MKIRRLLYIRRYRRRDRTHIRLLWLTTLCLSSLVLIFSIEAKMRPLVKTYAEGRARYIAVNAVNEAVEEELSSQGGIYDNIIYFEKNNEGNILAVKTDSIKINRLKSSMLSRINEKINRSATSRIDVPLGNIINGELFSGRGPRIPVLLQMVNSANASFISEFTAAGINQTRHRLIMDTTVGVSVLLPGTRGYFEVSSQVNLAETIIIGKVPDNYTDIVDTESDLLEKFNDYGGGN